MMPTACAEAIDMVVLIHEANRRTVDSDSIKNAVLSWYVNSDIVDPEMLAAAVLEYGTYRQITYTDWESAQNKWFPQYEERYAAWEYEASYYDEYWR